MDGFTELEEGYRTIDVAFDAEAKALWIAFLPENGVPSFTVPVLEELHLVCDRIEALFDRRSIDEYPPIRFVILKSHMSGMFNMGGDLGHIAQLSRAGDRAGLAHYGRLTAEIVFRMWSGLDLPIVTISAVDGNAFGGGFEAALSTQFLIAGPASRFAFPESRFGLFPGMGATSLIGRRVSEALAQRLILDANTLDGARAHSLGLCDRFVRRSSAEGFIRRTLRRGLGPHLHQDLSAGFRERRASRPYDRREAHAVVSVWVDAVLRLGEPRRRYIDKIVRAQRSKVARLGDLEPGSGHRARSR